MNDFQGVDLKTGTTFTINLVEDDEAIRERLINLVNSVENYQLLNVASCLEEAMPALEKHKPDLLLVDLGLPDGSGIDLIRQISSLNLDTEALVITGFQDEHTVFDALEAGAKGYILKHDESQNILDALKQIIEGGAPISPVIARLMLNRFNRKAEVEIALPEALTERQIRILKYVSQGFSSKEIAEKLNISYYTVTTHIKNIYNKLQVNSRTEAIFEAMRLGLIKQN